MQLACRAWRAVRNVAPITAALILAGTSGPAGAAEDAVAQVLVSKGASSARGADGTTRLLGSNAKIFVADTITTGSRSYVLIEFIDGTKITVRPGSTLVVEQYRHGEQGNEALFNLVKGGLRALTGLISKLNPDGYQVRTPVATMGIRGTEFDARLCEQDCAEENRRAVAGGGISTSKVIARVALKHGDLSARDITGRDRKLAPGGPVYVGDVINTGKDSYAVLVFRDDTRTTLQPHTEFVVQNYAYNPQSPGDNSALFNLVRGGLRTLTGAVARLNRPAFSLRTPTATMGVRGTGFDTVYRNPTWANVWSGEIRFETAGGTLIVQQDQTVYVPKSGAAPVILPQIPVFFRDLPGPRPDRVDVDLDDLFGVSDSGAIKPGLWVFVRDGHVLIDGKLDLGAGDAAFADAGSTTRLEIIPLFFLDDVIPLPGATGVSGPMSCEVR